MDHGLEEGHLYDAVIQRYRTRFEELLGNADGWVASHMHVPVNNLTEMNFRLQATALVSGMICILTIGPVLYFLLSTGHSDIVVIVFKVFLFVCIRIMFDEKVQAAIVAVQGAYDRRVSWINMLS
jgi:hypothetical protein